MKKLPPAAGFKPSREAKSETGVNERGFLAQPSNVLTLHHRSVALPDNVRDLLDWLIDEELKRWQRETR